MSTRFSLVVESPKSESQGIRSLAEEIFDEIRRLESLLSRFIEDSDVSRINRLQHGESTIVSPETWRCLTKAVEAARLTRGHFNVAYASATNPCGYMEPPFSLLTRPLRVRSETERLKIDLGGIGKGFALECIAAPWLRSYGYSHALLGADTSTILAMNPPEHPGWPVVIDGHDRERTVFLNNTSISCSGTQVRGNHIYHPVRVAFAVERHRVWVMTPSPTFADAFSTAAMTMTPDELAELPCDVFS